MSFLFSIWRNSLILNFIFYGFYSYFIVLIFYFAFMLNDFNFYFNEIKNYSQNLLAEKMGLSSSSVIVEGNYYIDSDYIRNIINLQEKPVIGLNLWKIKKRIEENALIHSVIVMRVLPNTLRVIIEEKTPFVLLKQNNKLFLVDKDGDIIGKSTGNFNGLPIIFGDNAIAYIKKLSYIINSNNILHGLVVGAEIVGRRRWNIFLYGGMTIKLPEDNPILAWQNVAILHQANNIINNNIQYIDLRVRNKIFINYG